MIDRFKEELDVLLLKWGLNRTNDDYLYGNETVMFRYKIFIQPPIGDEQNE